MQINKVLVPVDFSPPSTLAVNYGIALARRFRAKLTLLHVLEPSTALLYTFPTEAEKAELRRMDQAQRMLPALVSPEDQDDLDLEVVVRSGEIEAEIAATVREQKADVVVMGTHGRRLLGRWLIGSVTQSMLRKMAVPVLTVSRVSRPLEFKRILFATDLSASSSDGFRFALDLASTLRSKLFVTYVLEEAPAFTFETPVTVEYIEEIRHRLREDAGTKFAEFKKEAAQRNVEVETLLLEGNAGNEILRIAGENDIDFIVITVQERGFIERALGTTAEFLIREAGLPVVSMPFKTAGAREQEAGVA